MGIVFLILATLSSGFLPLLLAIATKDVFDFLDSAVQSGDWTQSGLWRPTSLYLFALIATRTTSSVEDMATATLANKVKYQIDQRLNDALVQMRGVEKLEDANTQDMLLTGRMAGQQGVMQIISGSVSTARQITVVGTLGWGILLSIPLSFPLLFGVVAIEFIVLKKIVGLNLNVMMKTGSSNRMAMYFSSILESSHFSPEIKVLGLDSFFSNLSLEFSLASITASLACARKSSFLKLCSGLVGDVSKVLMLALVAQSIITTRGTVGDLAFYVTAITALQEAFSILSLQAASFGEALLQIKHFERSIDDLRDTPTSNPFIKNNVEATEVSLMLSDIVFDYSQLHDGAGFKLEIPNLVVRAGEVVAIVGANGSGKSTLIKLMLGLYEPHSGTVKWKGRSLRECDIKIFRSRVGFVSQFFGRYPLSIEDNLTFSKAYSEEEVDNALEAVGLSDVVRKMPLGKKTLLGTWASKHSKAADLSGGQWQRIGIARSLIRRDAELIVWDEATSSLDPIAERDITLLMYHLKKKGAACVFVTHRIASAELADKILVMKTGQIVETGTHKDLLKANGVYAEMVHAYEEMSMLLIDH